jgi:hypothetical protein
MRTILIVAFSLCWMAGAAFAQTTQPPSSKATDASPAAGKKKGRLKGGDAAEKELPPPDGKVVRDAYASCLEIWDPATHMTRREWDRACRRVAERLREVKDMAAR